MAINIADLFEHAVDAVPDRTALVCGDQRLTYAELERRSNQFAHHLAERGVGKGSHVGLYARNGAEHVIAMLAVFKLRAIAINVNYRYVEGELDYLFDNADVVALVHERQYTPLVEQVFGNHERLTHAVVIEDGTDHDASSYDGVAWADALAGQSDERDFEERSADDLYIVYTGGTTGYPKGVMWRHEDVWRTLGGGIDFMTGERLGEYDQSKKAVEGEPMISFPLSPIMHGGAQWGMLMHLFAGHVVILVPKFEPAEIWRIVDREKVQVMFMTGDAMARPLIEEYERGDYDGSSLVAIASSAAIFAASVKERYLDAFPNAFITDSVGASETGFSGTGIVDRENKDAKGAQVGIGPETVILDEVNNILDPSTNVGAIGRLARANSVPLGYYKDPEKSARTFVEIDGVRYSIPGDFAQIEEGNRLTLLGRGSNCINTGGEKVYPEEVETALKGHPDVFDVLVVGTPDERLGQQVTAVIQPRDGREPTLDELNAHLRVKLSGYKLPRSMTLVPEIPRHATGKANYPAARQLATEARTAGAENVAGESATAGV
ncbi:MAG TPA: acyl-CoA synthetase [Nocardioidaceae bacterium]|nr:acyl-CoA synthetase [Nocardioidaceae bacterium]